MVTDYIKYTLVHSVHLPVCMRKRCVINDRLDNHVFLVHVHAQFVHVHTSACTGFYIFVVFSTSAVLIVFVHAVHVHVLPFNQPHTSGNSKHSACVYIYRQTEAWFQFIVSITVLDELGEVYYYIVCSEGRSLLSLGDTV